MEKERFRRAGSEGKERLAEKVSSEIARKVRERWESREESRYPEEVSEEIARGFRAKQKSRLEQRSQSEQKHVVRDESREDNPQGREIRVPRAAKPSQHPSEVRPVRKEASRRKVTESSRDVAERVGEPREVPETVTEVSVRQGLSEISSKRVEEILSEVDSGFSPSEKVKALADRVRQELDSVESGVVYADLSDRIELSQKQTRSLQSTFRNGNLSPPESTDANALTAKDAQYRFALVDERLYAWKRETDRVRLVDAYSSLYLYFKDETSFREYVESAESTLDADNKTVIESTRHHLEDLLAQMAPKSRRGSYINTQKLRLKVEHIDLMNSLTGSNLQELEGDVSKLTKHSGKGGIENPQFPRGERLEIALAQFTAVAISDCYLKPNGTLQYAEQELSRMRLVEKNLQAFGDIRLEPRHVENENFYVSYLPTPLGIMLQELGIPPGDRTVQNPGLFPEIHQFRLKAQSTFFEELIPQDGTVSGTSVQWSHSNVLDAADKAEVYGVAPQVGTDEVRFIKTYGNNEEHSWALPYGRLRNLRRSRAEETRKVAQFLWDAVHDNYNRLVRDGTNMLRNMGIAYVERPYTIRYHKRTGRVSVAWTAAPKDILESVKLAVIAPSNDEIKREKMKDIIMSHPEETRRALDFFEGRRISVDEWWK